MQALYVGGEKPGRDMVTTAGLCSCQSECWRYKAPQWTERAGWRSQ